MAIGSFDLAAEFQRHNDNQKALAISHGFLAVVLWLLFYGIAYGVVKIPLAILGVDSQWLHNALVWAILAALAWQAVNLLRLGRLRLAERRAAYGLPGGLQPVQPLPVEAAPLGADAPSAVVIGHALHAAIFSAPRYTALALLAREDRILLTPGQVETGEEALQVLGKATLPLPLAEHQAAAPALEGLERMGHLMRGQDEGAWSILLTDDLRARLFPKPKPGGGGSNSGAGGYAGPNLKDQIFANVNVKR